ncbi:MAG: hypothetical protein OEN22_01745 [Gammaproteobacteria bacterium]|nr:hypothetical protein [Gammaproteobacteria bacterium]
MTRINRLIMVAAYAVALCACGNGADEAPVDSAAVESTHDSVTESRTSLKPGESGVTTSKPQSPIQISYRIIGQPIVGQPVAIDLQFESSLEAQSFDVSYRVNDATALQFPESQPNKVAIATSKTEGNRGRAAQQVSVIPLREGRLYLNVAAEIDMDGGSFSSVTAVPIQVGQAPRELIEDGIVTTDENGELIRVLPAQED